MTDTETDSEFVRYTVDIVVIDDDGRVLLIRRGWPPHKGAWALPGGWVDPGETSIEAGVRELLEETGVQVSGWELDLVGVFDQPDRDPRGRYISAAYVVTVPAGTVATAGDDAADVQWRPVSAPGTLAFDHAAIISAARRQQAQVFQR
ncbi:NUDIX hydrolase [Streptomyces sp. NPDC088341]|uniref:NUDIX hydrolase n=1 Tax=Streptomyces sp. NPDC088341 TaxID=3154870 RepID=UPI0034414736